MAPVAYGVLALIAGVMVVAVLVGAAGGVINGRLKGELSLGAILAAGAYVLVVTSLESGSSWKIALFGLRPLLASLGALGCALLAGFALVPGCLVGHSTQRNTIAVSLLAVERRRKP